MIYVGLPYGEKELSTTTTGGTPYGASHVSWSREADKLSDDEKQLARALVDVGVERLDRGEVELCARELDRADEAVEVTELVEGREEDLALVAVVVMDQPLREIGLVS